ncbi:MAG TPA: T9SS type A sorting domain-containing protein [Candidatus Kapabacteria bacterium]|nr:T9SS type A sorting domain-containing protein [Candidatus Kapabacteria bacterium]
MRIILVFSCIVLISGAALAQPPAIGSCQIFPADNPWNTDISSYPLHSQSDVFIAAISEQKQYLHADFGTPAEYGIPFVIVNNTQPFVGITYDAYGDQSDPGPFPVPADAPVEGGASSTGDRHVLVVDTSDRMLYELFSARKDAAGTGWTASSGAKFDLSVTKYRPDGWTSADAAGLPIFPGLVRYEEVASGAINHALRFTAYRSQQGWITPARHEAGTNDTHYPPMGLRLRMKASYDISSVSGQSKIILQALKKYGMILADNGSSWFISGTSNPLWDDNDLNQLKKIPGSAFEVVYTGPIKTQPEAVQTEITTAGYLGQNIPNPVSSVTDISFSIPRREFVTLTIYNTASTFNSILLSRTVDEGVNTVRFDASLLPSGVYFYCLTTNEGCLIKKMIVAK